MADDYSFDTSTTGVVTPNGRASGGLIEVPGDKDLFQVALTAGTTYTFNLVRFGVFGLSDPYLQLFSGQGTLVSSDDDSGVNGQGRIVYTAPSTGTYYLGAMDFGQGTGYYNITSTSATSTQSSISVGALRTAVPEGDTVTFIISAPPSLAGNSYGYVLQGLSSADITSATINGRFTIGADGHVRIPVTIVNDGQLEGIETLTMGTDVGTNLSVTILDTSRPSVSMPAAARNVIGVYSMFYGSAPNATAYASEIALYQSLGSANAYAQNVAARFEATPNDTLARSFLEAVKVTSLTTGGQTPADSFIVLRDALSEYLGFYRSLRGVVAQQVVEIFSGSGIERDATWGAAAIQFNNAMGTTYTALPRLAEVELVGTYATSGESAGW